MKLKAQLFFLVAGLKAKRNKVVSSKNQVRVEDFYKSQFVLPVKSGPRKRLPQTSADSLPPKVPRLDQLVDDVKQTVSAGFLADLARLNSKCAKQDTDIKRLKQENHKLKHENNELKEDNEELQKKLKTYSIKRVNQTLKRSRLSADSWKSKYQTIAAATQEQK